MFRAHVLETCPSLLFHFLFYYEENKNKVNKFFISVINQLDAQKFVLQ